jgi:hypothetical protein
MTSQSIELQASIGQPGLSDCWTSRHFAAEELMRTMEELCGRDRILVFEDEQLSRSSGNERNPAMCNFVAQSETAGELLPQNRST